MKTSDEYLTFYLMDGLQLSYCMKESRIDSRETGRKGRCKGYSESLSEGLGGKIYGSIIAEY